MPNFTSGFIRPSPMYVASKTTLLIIAKWGIFLHTEYGSH